MGEKELRELILKKILIIFFAIIGLSASVKLAAIYYDSNFNPYALPSFCSINSFIDCDGIAQTIHSQFLGIPLAYWGIFFYVFVIFLIFAEEFQNIKFLGFLKVFKHPLSYISALGFLSFFISIILAGVSIFEIKKICVLCFLTYFLNLLIAVIATDFKAGIKESFKLSFKDFTDAVKVKKYLISFLLLLFFAAAVLTYTTLSYCFTPQVKQYHSIKKYVKMKTNPFKSTGNILGDSNAKLTVYIYTDYRCPICRVYNVIIHRAAKELGGFKIIHKNLPLDADCNRGLSMPFHQGSCMLAKYSIAAENQDRFWEFNSEIFEKQPKTEKDILKLAKAKGFDVLKLKEDANSTQTAEKLNKDIENAAELKIYGTPTIVINGKVYTGIKPYYDLKEVLLEAGAFERKGQ